MDLSEYLLNGEWTLRSSGAVALIRPCSGTWVDRLVQRYKNAAGEDEPFVSLVFNLQITRRQTYFLLNVIFPAALITLMAMIRHARVVVVVGDVTVAASTCLASRGRKSALALPCCCP